MRVAAQLYTVRNRLRDSSQLPAVLVRLREIGYEAVEVAGLENIAPEEFERQLRAGGLVACAAHAALENVDADPSTVGAQCRRWGCEFVVIPSLPTSYQSAAGFERFGRKSAHIAQALRPYGLGLAYHNHAFEFELHSGRIGMEILFDTAAPDELQAELDTYWVEYAGRSAARWIRRLAGRVPLVHLKDMSVVEGRRVQAEVGEGSLDWVEILAACRESGTRWLVVEQDECAGDPLDSLEISYRNLSRFLGAGA